MRFVKRRMCAVAITSVIALAGVMVAASPAYAASASCTAPYFHTGFARTCTTGSIAANSVLHFVDVHVDACSGSPWKVWDTQTGVTVATGAGSTRLTVIWGLYGSSYKAMLTDACWTDRIEIENNI